MHRIFGFTLIELLVALAIIAGLIRLIRSAVQSSHEVATASANWQQKTK